MAAVATAKRRSREEIKISHTVQARTADLTDSKTLKTNETFNDDIHGRHRGSPIESVGK